MADKRGEGIPTLFALVNHNFKSLSVTAPSLALVTWAANLTRCFMCF